ncbi:alpha/beta hydrolase [Streptomyces melanogenes]|uniref:alpha/beta hydrolase n=1 Tax=Streptomyces melanogenes TaxID=67326 RepID=UPI0037924CF4
MPDPHPFAGPTRFDGASDRVAVVIPGVGYSPARPLLHFARSVLLQHGWTVQELWWQIPDGFSQFTVDDRTSWVGRQVTEAIDAEAGACRLVVGNSLGSLACDIAADRDIPAAWLTPILTNDHVAAALQRATESTLLVGGSVVPSRHTSALTWKVRNAMAEIPAATEASVP